MAGNRVGWLFALAALAVMFLLLKQFITAIAFAAVTAFLWHHVHFRLRKTISETWSAALLTFITAVIVLAIVLGGAGLILTEFGNIYLFFSKLTSSDIISGSPALSESIRNVTRFFLTKVIAGLSNLASRIPHIVLSMLIYFITLFFFIKDGERLSKWVQKNVPMEANKKTRFFKDLNNYAHAFINIWLLIAVLQIIVGFFGFVLFGLSNPLLAGLLAGIFSLIPSGPAILYIPVGLYQMLTGHVAVGIGIITYGLVLGTLLDSIIRPYLTSRWSEVHPLIILLGIFGGTALLGPAGLIIGPIALMIVVTYFKDRGLKVFE